MGGILWVIAVILLVVWAVSFLALHVAGGLIHLLIVAAVILAVINLVSGRRTT